MTKEKIVTSFDRIAAAQAQSATERRGSGWNHNSHYEQLILSKLPQRFNRALDIGCGLGEFTAKLAGIAAQVVGIDIAPEMLKYAGKLNSRNNIEYLLQDIDSYSPADKFDCIISIATMHHLNIDTVLPKIREMLTPNGIFIVLDLYKTSTLSDKLNELASVIATHVCNWLWKQSAARSKEEYAAWRDHEPLDEYLTLSELRRKYTRQLPGSELKRLFFWRYLLVYRKPARDL